VKSSTTAFIVGALVGALTVLLAQKAQTAVQSIDDAEKLSDKIADQLSELESRD
jgi:hypothetical protein